MTWPSDYETLARMFFLASHAYAISNSKPAVVLDFEYKKLQPGNLRSGKCASALYGEHSASCRISAKRATHFRLSAAEP